MWNAPHRRDDPRARSAGPAPRFAPGRPRRCPTELTLGGVRHTLAVGMPGETEADIEKGFSFVETLPFNSINGFIAQAIPGSELFEKAMSNGAITYEGSLHIDTARSTLRLTWIDGIRLEQLVADFLERYNQKIYERDPVAWMRKYKQHSDRMAAICIGSASPNTAKILAVLSRTEPILQSDRQADHARLVDVQGFTVSMRATPPASLGAVAGAAVER